MLGKAILTTMFDYNTTTNARLLTLAANLSDEQLDAASGYSHDNVRRTLVHILAVEWIFRMLCENQARPTVPPPIVQTPTIPAMQAFAAEEGSQMQAFLEGASEDDLMTPFGGEVLGKRYELLPWQMLIHCLYHSAQHRSEVAELLTQYGQSPGNLDFILFENVLKQAPETQA